MVDMLGIEECCSISLDNSSSYCQSLFSLLQFAILRGDTFFYLYFYFDRFIGLHPVKKMVQLYLPFSGRVANLGFFRPVNVILTFWVLFGAFDLLISQRQSQKMLLEMDKC